MFNAVAWVATISVIVGMLVLMVYANRDARRAEEARDATMKTFEQRTRNMCVQQAGVIRVLGIRLARGEAVEGEIADAITYGTPAIWYCTGEWPPIFGDGLSAEAVNALAEQIAP